MTDKQARFCEEYLVDCNATQAAVRAGYSERSASTAAARNMQNDKVSDRIASLMKAKQEEVGVTVRDVLNGLLTEARGDGPDTSAAARIAAWDKLGKHLGIYEADNGQRATAIVVDLTGAADGGGPDA